MELCGVPDFCYKNPSRALFGVRGDIPRPAQLRGVFRTSLGVFEHRDDLQTWSLEDSCELEAGLKSYAYSSRDS